jgi:hypothetical protein
MTPLCKLSPHRPPRVAPALRSAFRGVAFAAALSVVTSVAGTASARPEMPSALQSQADMPCPVSCGICHIAPQGGGPRTAFGRSLEDPGFIGTATPESLATALGELRGFNVDSDGDGAPDVDELAAGTDPNGPGELCGFAFPEYGCARVEPRGRVDGVAGLAAALTVLGGALLARRGRH